jgi:DNA-binding transcriptional MerR regulator
MDRVPVSEAAARLGVTPDAVRQRIRRGTIQYEKTDDGRYFVFLTPHDGRRDGVPDGVQKALRARLHDENEFLRQELQRKDQLLAMALERIPAIEESPPEPQESPERASDERSGTQAPPEDQGQEKRPSWWRRFFGLEHHA